MLTVVLGVPLIKACGRRTRPILFAISVVVGLAPFYNLQGDYFEMGSIGVTRVLTVLQGASSPVYPNLRSDDVFRTIEQLFTEPATLGATGFGTGTAVVLIMISSMVLAILFAFLTYWMGHQFSRLFFRGRPAAKGRA